MLNVLLPFLKITIAVLVFATGLNSSRNDLLWLWRRPALLCRSFAAMYLLVPLAAVAIDSLFELPSNTRAALVLLSISAGAPLLPKRLIRLGGDPDYTFSLTVTASLLAIVTLPLSLHLLVPWLPEDITIAPEQVATTLLFSFLLPLAGGMGIRWRLRAEADRIGEHLLRLAGVTLLLGAAAMIFHSLDKLLALGLPTFLAFAGFTLAALLIGHLLGGPDHRLSLAVACATRHVGLAMLIAARIQGPKTLALVSAYLISSILISIPYIHWIRQQGGRKPTKKIPADDSGTGIGKTASDDLSMKRESPAGRSCSPVSACYQAVPSTADRGQAAAGRHCRRSSVPPWRSPPTARSR